MSKRVTASLTVFLLSAWAGVAAYSSPMPRVVDIRVGKHAKYDRLVIQLEKRVNIPTLGRVPDGSFVLELEALPLLPSQTLATPFKRLGTVQIDRTALGTRIRVAAKPRRIRVYLLESPSRIVVDFADPGPGPFRLPKGVKALTATSEPPVAPAPKAPPQEQKSAGPSPLVPKVLKATGDPTATREPRVATPAVAPRPAPPPPQAVRPLSPQKAPAGELPQRPPAVAVPRPAPAPAAEPRPEVSPKPLPARAASSAHEGLDGLSYLGMSVATLLTLLAIAGLGVALIAWVRMNAARRRALLTRAATAGLGSGAGVETILPDEVLGVGERTDILEKRIDEEVRARMHVEEHVKQLQEEIKVLRDRLHRFGRRAEGSA